MWRAFIEKSSLLFTLLWDHGHQQQLKQMNSLVLKVQEANQLLKINLRLFCIFLKTKTKKMQNHTVTPVVGAHILPTASRLTYEIKLEFSPDAPPSSGKQLKHLIADKIKNKEFFYGIEISATNSYPNTLLDYRTFGSVLPLFTSIVWLSGEYGSVKNIEEVESIKLARKLEPHVVVLPHFSCYRLQHSRLEEFLNLNLSNILTVRGDFYDPGQEYKYSSDLVKKIKELRGDSVTIGVAGYPEGHPECVSIDQDIDNLAKKIQAGADFIITQICFNPQAVIDFVKNCRAKDIKIPILIGIFVPDNLRMLESVLRFTQIKMSPEALDEYKKQNSLSSKHFRDYGVRKAMDMIEAIFSSDIDVYGLQFFTFNKFKSVSKVLNEINRNQNLIKNQ